jgi:hypothetical protein
MALQDTRNEDRIAHIEELTDSVEVVHEATVDDVEEKVAEMVEEVELTKQENADLLAQNVNAQHQVNSSIYEKEKTAADILKTVEQMESLFDDETQEEELLFGDPRRANFEMPMLGTQNTQSGYSGTQSTGEKTTNMEFDSSATLLPGAIPVIQKEEPTGPSITGDAKQIAVEVPTLIEENSLDNLFDDYTANQINTHVEPKIEPIVETKEKVEQELEEPELMLDDLDSLFE